MEFTEKNQFFYFKDAFIFHRRPIEPDDLNSLSLAAITGPHVTATWLPRPKHVLFAVRTPTFASLRVHMINLAALTYKLLVL